MRKVSRGKGFGGTVRYCLGRDDENLPPGELLGGNMAGMTAEELTREYGEVRRLRPDIEKPVWHQSLRLPEGEVMSDEKWVQVADDYMRQMGFDDAHQRSYFIHRDEPSLHIVANRIHPFDPKGKLYLGANENLRSSRITQKLEKAYGLQITKGPEVDEHGKTVMPAVKKPSKKELEMAMATGEELTRQKLQRLVDEAAEGYPKAHEFAERLEASGVSVRANVASTGRMNGFSFELDGVAFKASQLGNQYKWTELNKKVMYEQARDSQELAKYRDRAADTDRPGSERAPGQPGRVPADLERRDPRSGDRQGDSRELETARQLEQDDRGAADGRGRDLGRGLEEDGRGIEGAGQDLAAHGEDRGGGQVHRGGGKSPVPADRQGLERGGRPDTPGDRAELERDQTKPAWMVEAVGVSAGRGGSGRAPGPRWTERFRRPQEHQGQPRAGAEGPDAGRGLVQGNSQGKRADRADIGAVRQIDPTAYLQSRGYTVDRQGAHMSVRDAQGDEAYRISQKPEGHYVACDRHGQGVGDNIALVQQIDRAKLPQAVFALKGAELQAPQQQRKPWQAPTAPSPPGQSWQLSEEMGRGYLKKRGISDKTADEAQRSGFFRLYELDQQKVAMKSRFAVGFQGYDQGGRLRNLSLRATEPGGMQKQDVAGSKKGFPPILPGNPNDVLVVEGGMDALAAHDLARKRGYEPPTVLVSGGAGVRSFLETPHVQEALKRAERVSVAFDNEKDQETQERTDKQHRAQAQRIEQITGRPVQEVRPPQGVKDLAEANQQHRTVQGMQSIEQQKEEASRPKQEPRKQQEQRRPSPGMDMGMSR